MKQGMSTGKIHADWILMNSKKAKLGWQSTGVPPVQDQGARTGAFGDDPEDRRSTCRTFGYAATTKDEAQRRY